ncbi:23S rRNA (uracil(1939)-C(5))-methyltransferase RlmD [Roseofilum sp. Guam]|uniref:23S rRNA (uracil(1939)-C(5))-methyltransferase RlmD n=1 Tax=Roseofilum sp. Guam TaxID=2821502 RepID=UPI001B2F063C|nr:23S rRNA (uracil(1939)-C(5))-methyltransferase RlmD [Roseofilum sp. Guam]MBP0029546.1 23S rRNA (uracil(1939)-C(5))-methyltransferase RlmD [Roseofilum sp. Guam]
MKTEFNWKQGQVVEIEIASLSDTGDGVGRVDNRVVFVPNTVPGDRLNVRLLYVKPQFAKGAIEELLEPSPHGLRPACIVADKCGGCQWQHIRYDFQQQAKQTLVREALTRIGKFADPPVTPIIGSPQSFGYRNKVSYPLELSDIGIFKAGYYQQGTHKLINLNQCPVQDERLNPLLATLKENFDLAHWSAYDEENHQGLLRHLCLRIGQRTGEILITLVATKRRLPGLATHSQNWLTQFPGVVGVCLNVNPHKTNRIFGDQTFSIAGQPYVREQFAGLTFHLGADTFFQVNTEAAEALLEMILEHLNLQGTEQVVDAYCGIGTLTLPIARQVQQVLGLEVQPEAIQRARENAQLNQIENVAFQVGKVEDILPQLDHKPDIVLLDPPRQGCKPEVLQTLLNLRPARLVYVSCKPATLARDLQILCESGSYRLTRVQPVDFFPQTAHVEAVAFLVNNE